METSAHVAPSTPGWEILINSARALSADSANKRDQLAFFAQCHCRTDELIPEERRDDVAQAVFAAATKHEKFAIDSHVTNFLYTQFGRPVIEQLVEASEGKWKIKECDCGDPTCCTIVSGDPNVEAVTMTELIAKLGGEGIPSIVVIRT